MLPRLVPSDSLGLPIRVPSRWWCLSSGSCQGSLTQYYSAFENSGLRAYVYVSAQNMMQTVHPEVGKHPAQGKLPPLGGTKRRGCGLSEFSDGRLS